MYLQKDGGVVSPLIDNAFDPWVDGHVGNRVLVTAHIFSDAFTQVPVQNIHLTLGLHGKPVDGILDFDWCVFVEVTKPAFKKNLLCFAIACYIGPISWHSF